MKRVSDIGCCVAMPVTYEFGKDRSMVVDRKGDTFGIIPKMPRMGDSAESDDIMCINNSSPIRTVDIITLTVDAVKAEKGCCNVLMVGCSNVLDQTLDEANKRFKGSVKFTAATTDCDYDHIFSADEYECFVVHWDPREHEQTLIELTGVVCCGGLDVVVCCEPSTRILKRCLGCLKKGGTLITRQSANITSQVYDVAKARNQSIKLEL